jgi:hypothetical protein
MTDELHSASQRHCFCFLLLLVCHMPTGRSDACRCNCTTGAGQGRCLAGHLSGCGYDALGRQSSHAGSKIVTAVVSVAFSAVRVQQEIHRSSALVGLSRHNTSYWCTIRCCGHQQLGRHSTGCCCAWSGAHAASTSKSFTTSSIMQTTPSLSGATLGCCLQSSQALAC